MKIELDRYYVDSQHRIWKICENKGYTDAPFQGYCKALDCYRPFEEDGKATVGWTHLIKEFSFVLQVKENGEDLYLEIPESILGLLDWNIGDKLVWSIQENNTVTLSKIQ